MAYRVELKYISLSKRNEIKGLSFPLDADSLGGVFASVYNENAIKQGIIQMIKTQKGERVMYPDFGTTTRQRLFSKLDQVTHAEIEAEIRELFALYEPRVNLLQVRTGSPVPTENDFETSQLQIQVLVEFKDTPEVQSLVQIFINASPDN
jgi:phage baseplate assembly protein W